MLNQLNLIYTFITFVVECFSTVFEISLNITHALYKQKRPCKARRNVYTEKKHSTNARFRFYKSEIPVRW